jgi:hypothetical protein
MGSFAFDDTARFEQLADRSPPVAGSNVYGTCCVLDQMNFEARLQGVENRGSNAVIERQTAHPDAFDPSAFQDPHQIGPAKCRIAVAFDSGSFTDDMDLWRKVQPRMKFGTTMILDAMCRPRASLFSEANVTRRVPVPRGHDESATTLSGRQPAIQDRHNLGTPLHR